MGETSLVPDESTTPMTPGDTSPVDSPEPGEDTESSPGDEFEKRVSILMGMIEDDSSVRDRMLCELYVTVSEFSTSFRGFEAQMAKMGPAGFLKAMLGRGGKNE